MSTIQDNHQLPFTSNALVNSLRQRPDYVGHPRFMSSVGWREDRPGVHSLVHAINGVVARKGMAPITIIGRITPEGTSAGPDGTYTKAMESYMRAISAGISMLEPKLSEMKFVVVERRPTEDSDILPEWDQNMERIKTLVAHVAEGGIGEHFIKANDGDDLKIRTTQKMFIPRAGPVDEIGGKDETQNWPISDEFKDKLDKIYRAFQIQPLVLWKQGQGDATPVEPEDAQSMLNGALAEITFTLKHYSFRNRNASDGKKPKFSHTLVAEIQQIIIHRNAVAEAASPFRKNRLTRPHIPKMPVFHADDLEHRESPPAQSRIHPQPIITSVKRKRLETEDSGDGDLEYADNPSREPSPAPEGDVGTGRDADHINAQRDNATDTNNAPGGTTRAKRTSGSSKRQKNDK